MTDIYYGTSDVSTLCICPLCRRRFNKMMFWVGNGIPRMYCKECLVVVARRTGVSQGLYETLDDILNL